jgi:hypothetical protein
MLSAHAESVTCAVLALAAIAGGAVAQLRAVAVRGGGRLAATAPSGPAAGLDTGAQRN